MRQEFSAVLEKNSGLDIGRNQGIPVASSQDRAIQERRANLATAVPLSLRYQREQGVPGVSRLC